MSQESVFQCSNLYKPESISLVLRETLNSKEYFYELLKEKIFLVEKYVTKQFKIADLGCSNGNTLAYFCGKAQSLLGIDFTERYINFARDQWTQSETDIQFLVGNICNLPILPYQVDCAYSFSVLYFVDDFSGFLSNLKRLLVCGGIAVLDLGNRFSLNTYCCRFYESEDGYARMTCPSITSQLAMIKQAGFEILERRSFQLLPLWAAKPKWLYPLLHPKWKNIMKKRFKGKMLDEWISSLPVLRHFAFRHLVVCRKYAKED